MAYFLLAFVGAVSFAITVYLINFRRYKRLVYSNGCQPPRKYPHKEPIFGLDLFLQAGKMFGENRFFPVMFQRYQENGLTFETKTFGTPTICSCEPDNLQTVFATNAANWGVSYRLPALMDYCGRGFLTTDGADWEHSRALLNPSFTKANISDHSDFEHYVNLMINRIPKDSSTIDLQTLLFSLYLDTATLFLFGDSFDSLSGNESNDAQSFIHTTAYSLGGGGLRMALGPMKFLHWDPKWKQSNETVHQFINNYVDKALQRQNLPLSVKDSSNSDKGPRPVLLNTMAEQSKDRVQLRNEAIQAFIAASETTACLISNMFFLLARHPSVWGRLRKEILLLGDEPLNFDMVTKLKYLRNVINETLRFYPVFPYHIRIAHANTTLPVGGGVDGKSPIFIQKNSLFDANFAVLHRRHDIWGSDADVFNPDRWDTFKPKPWEFAPFGGGPRACVGRQKALNEASYLTVRLLRQYRAIEARDDRDWVGQVQITAKNFNGCKVALIPA